MSSNLNPFAILYDYKDLSSVTYVSPEDITSAQLSGGHLEAICDIIFLSKIFDNVFVIYPGLLESNNSFLDNALFLSSNIRLCPVSLPSSLLSCLLLSSNRPSFSSFLERYPDLLKTPIIVGCHRNFLFHLFLSLNSTISTKSVFFKSYGSIFLHNFDNIIASLNTFVFPRLFFAHLFSAPLRIFSDIFSFLYTSRIFITRSRQDVVRNPIGQIYDFLFGYKTTYACSGPYYFFYLHHDKLVTTSQSAAVTHFSCKDRIIVGSLGDNTFPTALYGIKQSLQVLYKYSCNNNVHITWNIAGKVTPHVAEKVAYWASALDLDVNILGYVDSVEGFYSTLDAYIVPVSGGSAMPIKALEAFCKLDIPIFITQYIRHSCSYFFKELPNIVQ